MFLLLLLFTSNALGLDHEVEGGNDMCPDDWVDASLVEMGLVS